MKYYKLLFCLIISIICVYEVKSASSEEAIGPIKVKHLTEDGIGCTYTVKRVINDTDVLDSLFAPSDSSLKSDYSVIFSSAEGDISFARFKELFKEGNSSLAVYIVKKSS